jgi:hypothetical protein
VAWLIFKFEGERSRCQIVSTSTTLSICEILYYVPEYEASSYVLTMKAFAAMRIYDVYQNEISVPFDFWYA